MFTSGGDRHSKMVALRNVAATDDVLNRHRNETKLRREK